MEPHPDVQTGMRSDRGETLVETLVSLVILGLAAVAILAGLQMSVLASDVHRKQSSGGAYVRSYAEAIENYLNTDANYIPCAGADAYNNVPGVIDQIENKPAGFSFHHSVAETLDGNGAPVASGACSVRDVGIQRIRLSVASTDGRATETLTIVVRKSCASGTSCA